MCLPGGRLPAPARLRPPRAARPAAPCTRQPVRAACKSCPAGAEHLQEGDHRGHHGSPAAGGQHSGPAALDARHHRVGGAQVHAQGDPVPGGRGNGPASCPVRSAQAGRGLASCRPAPHAGCHRAPRTAPENSATAPSSAGASQRTVRRPPLAGDWPAVRRGRAWWQRGSAAVSWSFSRTWAHTPPPSPPSPPRSASGPVCGASCPMAHRGFQRPHMSALS